MSLYRPLFRVLNASGTRYVVVGGVATVLHGYTRLTADIDLIIDLEREAARQAIRALVAFGLRPRVPVNAEDFADERIRAGWIRDKRMQVFSFFKPDDPCCRSTYSWITPSISRDCTRDRKLAPWGTSP